MALLIGSLLVGVIFQMMSGQARMAGVQSAREETQQNTRGALEVMSSELRSAVPAAILEATAQSLTFMQPRAWGLLCANALLATQVDVVVPNVGTSAAWAAGAANGVLVQQAASGALSPSPGLGVGGRASITASQLLATTACPLAPQGNVQVVRLTTSAAVSGTAGDLVALYTLTRYDVDTSDGRLWLRRNSGMSGNAFVQQPLAGPLATGRFDLEYRTGAGAVLTRPVSAAERPLIRQVRIRVVTESTQRLNAVAQRDSGEAVVTLRNPL